MNIYELKTTIRFYDKYIRKELQRDFPQVPCYEEYVKYCKEHNRCQWLTEYAYRELINTGNVVLDK